MVNIDSYRKFQKLVPSTTSNFSALFLLSTLKVSEEPGNAGCLSELSLNYKNKLSNFGLSRLDFDVGFWVKKFLSPVIILTL